MAEAVATLALASSILQVIDFGTKVASIASTIYQASKRNDESLNELENIYKNLSSTLDTIQNNDAATFDSGVQGMKSLAKSCSELSKELVDTLHKIGFGEIETKRKALWVALKHAWKEKELRDLLARLNELRSQLTMCLLVSLRQFAGQSLFKQEEILEKLGKMGDGLMGPSVLEYITARLDASSQGQHRSSLRKNLIDTIQEQKAIPGDDASTHRVEFNQKVKQESIDQFLMSLKYTGMQDREDRIADAHESTFKWIFEKSTDKWVGFREWLESDGKLYWITGKAGSGKSTMMRYISHPYPVIGQQLPRSRSNQYLEQWAGSKRLIVAAFYFWNSGVELQTRQTGLFSTLLWQILQQCPDLLPFAAPGSWENLCLFGLIPEWTDFEMRSMLFRCIENLGHLNATVALFVDGLDEFGGDLNVLISLFEEIQKLPHHKLCVASRPWNEFRDAFAQKPSLMVEHLTHDDIKKFVIARFDSHPGFVQLRLREAEFANRLAEDIVAKSSGVFLWVSLVVSSLLSGMGNGDRISDLQRRLDLLPADLTDLYRKMIGSLEPFYLEHAAQLFALVRASREPMNLLLATYADEENSGLALQQEVAPLSNQDIQIRMDTMSRRINSRSRGLLEVGGGMSTPQGMIFNAENHERFTVEYLHRTVKDFIENDSATQATLKTALHSAFDPHLRMLAGRLAYLKSIGVNSMSPNEWGACLLNCFFNARAVQASNIETMVLLLDRLHELCPSFVSIHGHTSLAGGTESNDLEMLFEENHVERGVEDMSRFTFKSLATACNVVEYVRARAGESCLTLSADGTREYALLMDAVWTRFKTDSLPMSTLLNPTTSAKERYKATIEALLERGADPKFTRDGRFSIDNGGLKVIKMSPLVMAALGYMTTRHELYLIACQSLAKKAHFDSTTITRIMKEYMIMYRNEYRYKKRFGLNLWSWHLMKSHVRNALCRTAKGNPPDFEQFWHDLFPKGWQDEVEVKQFSLTPHLVR